MRGSETCIIRNYTRCVKSIIICSNGFIAGCGVLSHCGFLLIGGLLVDVFVILWGNRIICCPVPEYQYCTSIVNFIQTNPVVNEDLLACAGRVDQVVVFCPADSSPFRVSLL